MVVLTNEVNKFFDRFLEVLLMLKDVGLVTSHTFSYCLIPDSSRVVIQERHLQIYVKFLQEAKEVLEQLSTGCNNKQGYEDIILNYDDVDTDRVGDTETTPSDNEADLEGSSFTPPFGHIKDSTVDQQFVSTACELTRFSPLQGNQFAATDNIGPTNHYLSADTVPHDTCFSLGGDAHENSISTHENQYSMSANQITHYLQQNDENRYTEQSSGHLMQYPSCSHDSMKTHFQNQADTRQNDYVAKPSCDYIQHRDETQMFNTGQERHYNSTYDNANQGMLNASVNFTGPNGTTQHDNANQGMLNASVNFTGPNGTTQHDNANQGMLNASVNFTGPNGTTQHDNTNQGMLNASVNFTGPNGTTQHYQNAETFAMNNAQYVSCAEPAEKTQYNPSNEQTGHDLHYPRSDMCEPTYATMTSATYIAPPNTQHFPQNEATSNSRFLANANSWGVLPEGGNNYAGNSNTVEENQGVRSPVFSEMHLAVLTGVENAKCVVQAKDGGVDGPAAQPRISALDSIQQEGSKWRCPLCNRAFLSRTNLERHYRVHMGEKAFPCNHCNKGFTSKIRLDAHLVRQHNLNIDLATPCPDCGKLFTTRSALDTHRLTHADDDKKPFSCKVCSKRFSQKVALDAHSLVHSGPASYSFHCEICCRAFPTKAKLNFHWRTHENRHACPRCPRKFATPALLHSHVGTHDATSNGTSTDVNPPQGRPFQCSQCPRAFVTNYKLQQHIETHATVAQYSCSQCTAQFRARSSLLSHIRIRHQQAGTSGVSPQRIHKCTDCSKVFARASNLRDHQRAQHSNAPPLACPVCPKHFKSRSKLLAHQRTHTEEPPLSCSTCSRRFFRRDLLRAHELTHTGRKPFSCDVCSRRFATRSILRSHQAKHQVRDDPNAAPDHTCSHCAKKFKTRATLALHMKSHADQLEFTCTTCNKQFARRVHWEGHMRTHSSERPYPCNVCGRAFRERKHRTDHVRRLHPGANEDLSPELTLQGLLDSITDSPPPSNSFIPPADALESLMLSDRSANENRGVTVAEAVAEAVREAVAEVEGSAPTDVSQVELQAPFTQLATVPELADLVVAATGVTNGPVDVSVI